MTSLCRSEHFIQFLAQTFFECDLPQTPTTTPLVVVVVGKNKFCFLCRLESDWFSRIQILFSQRQPIFKGGLHATPCKPPLRGICILPQFKSLFEVFACSPWRLHTIPMQLLFRGICTLPPCRPHVTYMETLFQRGLYATFSKKCHGKWLPLGKENLNSAGTNANTGWWI